MNDATTPLWRLTIARELAARLGAQVELLGIAELAKSTRDAPWRVDTLVDGQAWSFVWQPVKADSLEFAALTALAGHPLPTPRPWLWDPAGKRFGRPSMVVDFIAGESLMPRLRQNDPVATEIYLNGVQTIQAITPAELGSLAAKLDNTTIADELADAAEYFAANPDPVAREALAHLEAKRPDCPDTHFSNGDLWPDNLLFRNDRLVGVIDFESVMFADPLYEFLNLGFVNPLLRDLGLEEAYCDHMGFDPGLLPWYHLAEKLITWALLAGRDLTFMGHSPASLRAAIEKQL